MFNTKTFTRGFTVVLAAALAFGLGAFTAGLPTVATPAHANGLTITKKDGNRLTPQGTTCASVAPGTPCVAYYSGASEPILELAYVSSLDIEQIANTSGNLTIHVYGDTNVIGNTDMTAKTALNVAGDLTVLGKTSPAKLMIDAAKGIAISLSGESSFNVGDDSNPVTLKVTAGFAPPSDDARLTLGVGSNYIVPSDPPPGPPSGCVTDQKFTLIVGRVKVVENDVIQTPGVEGVKVEGIPEENPSIWLVGLTAGSYGPIEIIGSVTPMFGVNEGENVEIDASAEGWSIKATDCAGVYLGGDNTTYQLAGGIYSDGTPPQGGVIIDGVQVNIGSADSPSLKGIQAAKLDVGNDKIGAGLNIYTTSAVAALSGLPGITANPDAGEPGREPVLMKVSVGQGATLSVDAAGDATTLMDSVTVTRGGKFILSYLGALEDTGAPFALYSQLIPVNENAGECIIPSQNPPDPIIETVPRDATADDLNAAKVSLSITPGSFDFSSTANVTRNLMWTEGLSGDAVTGGNVCVIASNGYSRFDSSEFGTGYTFEIEQGSEVTIKLLPDHENQFLSGEFAVVGPPVNPEPQTFAADVPLDPVSLNPIQAKAAEYTFAMPAGSISLSTVFESVPDDPATITATDVTSASVGGPPTAINGNAELTIAEGTPADKADYAAIAGTRTIASYLDISLDQVIVQGEKIEQGATRDQWTQPLTDLAEPVEISMELDASLQGFSEYQVIRDHNGEVSAVPASYDPATGTLTFETDGFSTYAIAHGPKVANPFTYDAGVEHDYYQAWASGLALLTLLGGALLWRKLSVS